MFQSVRIITDYEDWKECNVTLTPPECEKARAAWNRFATLFYRKYIDPSLGWILNLWNNRTLVPSHSGTWKLNCPRDLNIYPAIRHVESTFVAIKICFLVWTLFWKACTKLLRKYSRITYFVIQYFKFRLTHRCFKIPTKRRKSKQSATRPLVMHFSAFYRVIYGSDLQWWTSTRQRVWREIYRGFSKISSKYSEHQSQHGAGTHIFLILRE